MPIQTTATAVAACAKDAVTDSAASRSIAPPQVMRTSSAPTAPMSIASFSATEVIGNGA